VKKTTEQEIEASQILQKLLLISAGLARLRPQTEITSAYDSVTQFRNTYRTIDENLHHVTPPRVANLELLLDFLARHPPDNLILATAHHGHFVAFFSACARAGIPLATCYRSASNSYLAALRQSGVALVDLDAMRSVAQIFDTFDRLRTAGRYIALMIDAPFASRRHYQFMGYHVTASSMPSLYARRCGASILPLIGNVISAELLGYVTELTPLNVRSDRTQDLLEFLEGVILDQPQQYAWTTNSIFLSDSAFRESAFSFTLNALHWRNTMSHRT
jgi:lauroyl/myristoyl acyltransferase